MKFDLMSLKAGFGRCFGNAGKGKKLDINENHGKHLITAKSSMRVLEAYRMARTNLF